MPSQFIQHTPYHHTVVHSSSQPSAKPTLKVSWREGLVDSAAQPQYIRCCLLMLFQSKCENCVACHT